MNRIKRTISLLLVFSLMMAFLSAVVMAAEPELVYIRVSDGDTEKSYKVIHENNDIYFSAEAFSEITGYAFTASANYGYQLGRKIIVVNPTNGDLQIPVLHYTGNIGEIIEVDGTHYLSASQLLPWMNVTCSVNNGVLTIVADKASIWKITQDLDYSLYMFNLYEQYGDSFGSVSGLIAMTVFDTILHTRWGRIMPSGKGGSMYTYECYVQALSELGSDRPDLDNENIRALKKYVDVSDGIDPLAEFIGGKMEDGRDGLREHLKDVGLDDESILNILSISDDWDQMRECLSIPGVVTEYVDIFEAYKTYELILETDDEYRDYLAWLADRGTGTRMFDDALDEAQACLDENKGVIYTLISGFAEKLLEVVPSNVFKAMASNSMNDTVIKAFNVNSAVTEVWSSCGTYLTVAELAFETFVPEGVKGFEGTAKVGVLENIQDHCWNLAGYLQNEELTEENIVHIRQSYMTALRASRQMFESQEDLTELAVQFGAKEYTDAVKPQLDLINMKIQQMIASADCTENDSVEGKQEYADQLKEMFANISFYSSETDMLFDETYWVWTTGETLGSRYVVLFHKDGTMEYCHANTQGYGVTGYSYDNDLLTVNGAEYRWDGEYFVSTEKLESLNPDGTYYSFSLDSDGTVWRPILEEVLDARASFFREMEQAQNIDKRLVQVKQYTSGGGILYDFKYDEDGLLTEIVETRYGSYQSEYMPDSIKTTLVYDDAHRLLSRTRLIQDEWGTRGEGAEYTYNSAGKLIASTYGVSEGGGGDTSYEYDVLGYPMIITASWIYGEEKYHYAFDSDAKTMVLVKNSWVEDDVSDYLMFSGSESYSISYQYKPFVVYGNGCVSLLDCYGNGNAIDYGTGSLLFSLSEFVLSNPKFYCDEDGYLIKVIDDSMIDESMTYELVYE